MFKNYLLQRKIRKQLAREAKLKAAKDEQKKEQQDVQDNPDDPEENKKNEEEEESKEPQTRWLSDLELLKDEPLFEEYLEMGKIFPSFNRFENV